MNMSTGFPMGAQAQQIAYVRKYVNEQMPRLPYHNPSHAQDVAHTADFLGNLEGVKAPQRFLLETAGWLHDVVYKPHALNNEELSAADAARVMNLVGYDAGQIGIVKRLILATKPNARPRTHLEKIIKDADMWNLATNEFIDRSEAYRADLGVAADAKWYTGLKTLLDDHTYYTTIARQLLNPGLEYNRTVAQSLYDRALIPGPGLAKEEKVFDAHTQLV